MAHENLKLKMDDYLPLRDVVFNTLRQAILTGEFIPGERLMEVTLANQLGVSRTPVREAIRKLELEGLVEMIPRRGAHVAKITVSDMKEVLEVRCHLEEFAAVLACQRITEQQKEDLKAALEDFEEAIAKKDSQLIAEKDVSFHDVIFTSTKNPKLVQIISNLREQFYRYRIEYIKDAEYHQVLVDEHKKIYESITAGDEEAAKDIMHQHIYNQELIVIKNLKKQEDEAKQKK